MKLFQLSLIHPSLEAVWLLIHNMSAKIMDKELIESRVKAVYLYSISSTSIHQLYAKRWRVGANLR